MLLVMVETDAFEKPLKTWTLSSVFPHKLMQLKYLHTAFSLIRNGPQTNATL